MLLLISVHLSRFIGFLLVAGGFCISTYGRVLQYVPPGHFTMGDASFGEVGEGMADERPVHTVTVGGFYLEDQEVTAGLWESVREWAVTNGYPDLPTLTAPKPEQPAVGMSWYEAVKWCNARSEMEGWAPVYFTDAGHANVYRAGTIDLTTAQWNTGVPHAGYRLPTEAEWERAARGGVEGTLFPWPSATNGSYQDHITINQAAYDASAPSNVASFGTTGFRLCDMAGNAAEWCWDAYDADYYSRFPTNNWPSNPCGPDPLTAPPLRVSRGGGWASPAFDVRCSFRDAAPPAETNAAQGFRCAQDLAGIDDDRDSDGLPDWWTQQYFGHPAGLAFDKSRATDDATGTGMNNLQKYTAGLDPTNPLSVFRAETGNSDSNGLVIRWSSVSNRTYDVHFGTNLFEDFVILETNLPPSPPLNVYTDRLQRAIPLIFYRIGVTP